MLRFVTILLALAAVPGFADEISTWAINFSFESTGNPYPPSDIPLAPSDTTFSYDWTTNQFTNFVVNWVAGNGYELTFDMRSAMNNVSSYSGQAANPPSCAGSLPAGPEWGIACMLAPPIQAAVVAQADHFLASNGDNYGQLLLIVYTSRSPIIFVDSVPPSLGTDSPVSGDAVVASAAVEPEPGSLPLVASAGVLFFVLKMKRLRNRRP